MFVCVCGCVGDGGGRWVGMCVCACGGGGGVSVYVCGEGGGVWGCYLSLAYYFPSRETLPELLQILTQDIPFFQNNSPALFSASRCCLPPPKVPVGYLNNLAVTN